MIGSEHEAKGRVRVMPRSGVSAEGKRFGGSTLETNRD